MNAPNWEVRRTAAFLLREFGGAEGLQGADSRCSTDTEPLVQREAVQGLVMNGSDEAVADPAEGADVATGRPRETLLAELTEHARRTGGAALHCYLVRHHGSPQGFPQLYLTAIEALGGSAGRTRSRR